MEICMANTATIKISLKRYIRKLLYSSSGKIGENC